VPRVLLIEDEAVLRSSMARALRKAPGLDVDEAATVDEALVLLDAAAPDIVLSDLDLPGRSGIEILGELGRRKINVPVVFISAYLKAYGALIPRHANVEVREKPVGIDELRQLVSQRVSPREKAHDSSPFSAADFVQLACMGRHSVAVELKRGGRVAGAIRIFDGEIWSAFDEEGDGAPALRRVLFAKDGLVTCRTLFDAPGPREVAGGWQELLIEAARLEDEEAAGSGAAGAGPAPGAADAALENAFEDAFDEGVSALLRKDYVSALRAFRRAGGLRPGDGKVEANLARLHDMGIVDPDTGV
jgi:CheY-like chemotaxis protein